MEGFLIRQPLKKRHHGSHHKSERQVILLIRESFRVNGLQCLSESPYLWVAVEQHVFSRVVKADATTS